MFFLYLGDFLACLLVACVIAVLFNDLMNRNMPVPSLFSGAVIVGLIFILVGIVPIRFLAGLILIILIYRQFTNPT